MKLWILRPINAWEPWYDKAFGFVVRAETEDAARTLASEQAGDELSHSWMMSSRTSCVPLEQEGEAAVIIRDFAAA